MNKQIWILALFGVGALLLWLSQGLNILDARFYYSPYEALGFLAELKPQEMQRLRLYCLVDILLFIPLYATLFYQLTSPDKGRILQIVLLTVGTTADLFETILEFLGTYEVGWISGWLPQALSLSTPTKWLALILWGFCALIFFVRRRFG